MSQKLYRHLHLTHRPHSQRPPKISVSSASTNMALATQTPNSTVSSPSSCAKAVTLPAIMAPVVNPSTAKSSLVSDWGFSPWRGRIYADLFDSYLDENFQVKHT